MHKMENPWLEAKRDIFLRDLVHDFIEAKLYADMLYEKHSESAYLTYSLLDKWVGSENAKGPLWNLKDLCHNLFRNKGTKSNLYEHLFDWIIGSIFHEAIKLKEDAYQVETYKPLLEQESLKHPESLSHITKEYFEVIENARTNLSAELVRIHALFSKALSQLIEILPLYRNNILLVRFLLDNAKLLSEKVFGKKKFNNLIQDMFPEGMAGAYLFVAERCLQGGWYREAVRYVKKALKIDATNKKAHELLQQAAQETI